MIMACARLTLPCRPLTVVVNVGVNHVAIHINLREYLFVRLVNAEAANLLNKTVQCINKHEARE